MKANLMQHLKLGFLDHIYSSIEKSLQASVIVIEIGHIKTPIENENYQWAQANISLADAMVKHLIKCYGRRIRVIPTLIINDFSEKLSQKEERSIIGELLSNCTFIKLSSLKVFHERTLRNRSVAKLKKKELLQVSYDRVFIKGRDNVCSIPIGNLSAKDRATIIPRCGMIAYSYINDSVELSYKRLHLQKLPLVNILSFSQHLHEMESMKIGSDIHWLASGKNSNIQYSILHWRSDNSYCLSKRFGGEYEWATQECLQYGNENDLTITSSGQQKTSLRSPFCCR